MYSLLIEGTPIIIRIIVGDRVHNVSILWFSSTILLIIVGMLLSKKILTQIIIPTIRHIMKSFNSVISSMVGEFLFCIFRLIRFGIFKEYYL